MDDGELTTEEKQELVDPNLFQAYNLSLSLKTSSLF